MMHTSATGAAGLLSQTSPRPPGAVAEPRPIAQQVRFLLEYHPWLLEDGTAPLLVVDPAGDGSTALSSLRALRRQGTDTWKTLLSDSNAARLAAVGRELSTEISAELAAQPRNAAHGARVARPVQLTLQESL